MGLAEVGDRLPHELPFGLQKRADLARAVSQHPEVLLLDEPFGGLDVGERAVIASLIRELRRTGTTIVIARGLVSHPTLLVLDEPALGLAPTMIEEVYGRIAQLVDGGLTVVLLEQLLARALAACAHIAVLRDACWWTADHPLTATSRPGPRTPTSALESQPRSHERHRVP